MQAILLFPDDYSLVFLYGDDIGLVAAELFLVEGPLSDQHSDFRLFTIAHSNSLTIQILYSILFTIFAPVT